MVLRILVLALLVGATGCKQSLFDNKSDDSTGDDTGSDGGPGGDGSVPSACTAPCLGDAGGDFDGTAMGTHNHHWRYLDDNRNRSWTAMTAGTPSTGAGMNKIAKCNGASGGAACATLPDALLVTSTGMSGTADPAVELTIQDNVVAQLALRVRVPDGASSQIIRLYRSAREDVLFTGNALPGTTLETTIKVDALKGDRILLSVAPTGAGAADVAVQLFASETADLFPKECQYAFDFEMAAVAGNTLMNRCGTDAATYTDADTGNPTAPTLGTAPFPELGKAGAFIAQRYYKLPTAFDRSGDNTMQLWFKRDGIVDSTAAWLISDEDLDDGDQAGGISVAVGTDDSLFTESTITYGATAMEQKQGFGMTPYPNPAQWHFIRVVQKGDKVSTCLDGIKKYDLDMPIAVGTAQSSDDLRIGSNKYSLPSGGFINGQIDDVRMIKGALPCE
ncbi:MAG TPA: LamG-like jellyroll fold domain-containing protein [Kofleriaceae bacterium]